MYRTAKIENRRNDSNAVRTVFASAFGLTPVAVVSGMMVMQMLGLWTY